VTVPFTVPLTMKKLLLNAVPPAVVTAMGPDVAPAGTLNVSEVPVLVVMPTGVPLSVTPVAPFRFVPLTVTTVPAPPLGGANDDTIGIKPVGNVMSKVVSAVAIPAGFASATETGPSGAPGGTVARTWVADTITYVAGTPANCTETVPTKFVPLSVTVVPTGPLAGVKEVIAGANPAAIVTVKFGV
jgi:hypothetical protein